MIDNLKEMREELLAKIRNAVEVGVTTEQAERLSGECFLAQVAAGEQLTKADHATRMRKTGVKSIRAAIYLDSASKGEKKPTEAMLAALVDSNELVTNEQKSFDESEVEKNELERYYNEFNTAHVFYRIIAKGTF